MPFKDAAIGGGLALVATVAIWTACGPSLRRTHQSDLAFEHCFDMDYDPGTLPDDKSACWRLWLAAQVYNQPDDKIRYAELRRMELARGISVPGPPGMPGQFFKRPRLLVDAGFGSSHEPDAGPDAGPVIPAVQAAPGAPALPFEP